MKSSKWSSTLGNTTCFQVTAFMAFCKVSGVEYLQVHLQIQVQDLV